MEDTTIGLRNYFWFMNVGAPVHFSAIARNFLDVAYSQRWIGKKDTQH